MRFFCKMAYFEKNLPPSLQRPLSLSQLEEALADNEDGGDELFGDHGRQVEETYSEFDVESLLGCLTNRQRKVTELLLQGYKRKEIAGDHLHVVLQAIHQIVPRIRKRLIKRADEMGIESRKFHGFLRRYEN